MRENFDASLSAVLKDEGGNDNDAHDHGGRTSRGITQREYDAWRRALDKPERDVWGADTAEIRQIYFGNYWIPECDDLPAGIDYAFFDMAVNGGPFRAAKLLQRALGVPDDGKIGPVTRAAVARADGEQLLRRFDEKKRAFYRSLNQPRFLKGWLNRSNHVLEVALAMAEVGK